MPRQRQTQQRSAIHRAMKEAGRPLSPTELLAAARRGRPDLGMATVYRTIRKLVEDRQAVAVDIPGEPARYEPSGKPHHHHFLCRACGRLLELEGCPIPLRGLAPGGFAVEGHDLTLYGTCPDCGPRRPAPRKRR